MWSVLSFLRDERGGYTIWSLIWFSLYVAMGGLAVDMTNAYRNQTLLQSTADASALAGVMSLPDQTDAVIQALAYAPDNMNPAINGDVLKEAEVILGNWDFATRTFAPGTTAPDAVRVITRRDDANNNPVATNFLRILGLWGLPMDRWNISVEAVATKYLPECLLYENSLIAGNKVDVTSNNIFDNVCIHGQNMIEDTAHDYAVEIQNNGTIMDNVGISMPYLEDMIGRPTICSNDGLCEPGVLIAGDLMPTEAFLVDEAITGMLDPTATDTDYLPDDLYSVNAETSELVPPNYVYIDLNNCEVCVRAPDEIEYDPVTGEKLPRGAENYEYGAVMEPGIVYVISCTNPMNQLILPSPELQPVLQGVAIISECRIKGQENMRLEGVLLAASHAGGGKKPYNMTTIHFPDGTRFGAQDNCAPGGGVRIYSGASVFISAGASIDGMQIVARGNVELTANETINGLSVQAGLDIRLTANADVGTGCVGGVDGVFAWRYRLVL